MTIDCGQIDPELRLRGRIVDLIMTRSSEEAYRRHVRFVGRVQRLVTRRRPAGTLSRDVYVSRRGSGALRLRVVAPPGHGGKRPGIVWIHGGGYAIGVPEFDTATHRMLALELGCVVIAPEYRLSTQAPYPAALDDCWDAILWMRDHAAELGVRDDLLMVGGNSAGGGLAAAVGLRARDSGDVRIACQIPLYPMIDDRMATPSAQGNDAPVWNSKTNRWAWRLYLGERYGGEVPSWAAPARATDLAGLPRTVTFVGDLEPFRDETVSYVERLRAAGVPVDFEVFNGCYHAFDTVAPEATVSRRATAFWTDALRRAIHPSSPT